MVAALSTLVKQAEQYNVTSLKSIELIWLSYYPEIRAALVLRIVCAIGGCVGKGRRFHCGIGG